MTTPADNRAENTPLPLAKSKPQPTFSYSYILLIIILSCKVWPNSHIAKNLDITFVHIRLWRNSNGETRE